VNPRLEKDPHFSYHRLHTIGFHALRNSGTPNDAVSGKPTGCDTVLSGINEVGPRVVAVFTESAAVKIIYI
jgi:hypothetical protein